MRESAQPTLGNLAGRAWEAHIPGGSLTEERLNCPVGGCLSKTTASASLWKSVGTRAVTWKQRNQAAFCAKTLRAAVLLSAQDDGLKLGRADASP